MITSVMLVAVPTGVTAGSNEKWTSELYAWDPVDKAWVNGNLAGYREGDLVGFKYVLTHNTGTNDSSPELDSVYDHFNKGKGAYGIDAEVLWGVNTVGWDTQFPVVADGVRNEFNTIDPIEPTLSNVYFGMSGQVIQNYYMFEAGCFTVPVGSSIYIYFQAHLAETAFYSKVMTTPGQGVPMGLYKGAAFFPGASLQVALSLVFTGTSAQTQSIPVSEAVTTGSISGMKFYDGDSDGMKDPGELGLSGWKILLHGTTVTGSLDLNTTTASDGSYSFTGLPFGTYTVSEYLADHPGWTQTYPDPRTWTGLVINATHNVINGIDFGNSAPGMIRAHKLIDFDGDRMTPGDQSPGVNWEFELFYESAPDIWTSLGKKSTGSDGYTQYWENLLLGNYKVVETPQCGYSGISEKFISLTTADQEITMTFLNQPLGNITVSKVIDQDGDLETKGDQINGGAGWEFELFFQNGGWSSKGKKTTDGNGSVTWTALRMGNYRIVETPWDYWHNAADAYVTLNSACQEELVVMYNSPPKPSIHIEKAGPATASVGQQITYTFLVSNNGEAPLSNVSVMDSIAGAATYVSGDENEDGILNLEEVWEFTASYTIKLSDGDPLINVATATGYYEGTPYQDTDNHTLYIDWKPMLAIDKAADMSVAEVGDVIHYTIEVSHAAGSDGSPISSVVVADSLGAAVYQSGDDGDGLLELGEKWLYTFEYTVTVDTPDPLDNTATASGTDKDGEPVGPVNDTWRVDIAHPMVDIEKYVWDGTQWLDADTLAEAPWLLEGNGSVAFLVVVTNIGDVAIQGIAVMDSDVGQIVMPFLSLLPGESMSMVYAIAWTEGDQVNTANVTALFRSTQIYDEDDAWYFGAHPCINVTKTVGYDVVDEDYTSHTIGYWKNHPTAWTVINPTDIFPYRDVNKYPTITYLQVLKTSPRGDASIILAHQYIAAKLNDIAWGAPAVYDGFIHDAEEFLEEFPVGSNPQGADREYAIMLAEALTDYNEGNHNGMAFIGVDLVYTVNVTNCGNVALYNVKVYDSLLDAWFYLADFGDLDGILDVGEWWNFTYTYTIPEDSPSIICNVATAYGQWGEVEWDTWVTDEDRVCIEVWYYAATQGYWKNHGGAWIGISPDAMFFDSGMTWMEVFWTPPAGDMIIVLAHQYMAAMLNDERWGVPAKYADVIDDATNFLTEHQIGDDLTPEERETAHDLAELLAEYNEGGIHP